MPKRTPPLSEDQIINATFLTKPYKLNDGRGLYLLVTPTGGKLWRAKYHFENKEKSLSFGAYPSVSLADARQRLDDAKKILSTGIDPGEVNKERKADRRLFDDKPRLCICMEGVLELWKGRDVIRLTREEAVFVKDQLSLLT